MTEKNIAAFYTRAELARYFNVPESTMRFYCSRFAEFLPSTGEGRKRRYAFACLEVLACIRKQLPRLRSSDAMEHALAERFPRTLPSSSIRPSGTDSAPGAGPHPPTFPSPRAYDWGEHSIHERFSQLLPPDNLPAEWTESSPAEDAGPRLRARAIQNGLMRRISEAMELLTAESREKAGQLEARADAADREISELREEMRNMRLQMDTAEKTQQADIEQLRALLLRVTRKLTEREA